MKMHWSLSTLFILLALTSNLSVKGLICSRYPANSYTSKSPVDENFSISIWGNPQSYMLGQTYNISVNAYNGLRYIGFLLALENDNGDPSYDDKLGRFEIIDHVETRFSPNCINMVETTNTHPKTRVDVSWIAPTEPGTGCVLIRTTLVQHRDVWFMDDGGLTKRICEEVVDDVESLSPDMEDELQCCACDEARYELTFQNLWSRNLHPKDFPEKGWTAHYSDILGAAHTPDYRFWVSGQFASDAMKDFAEHGSTDILENEFKSAYEHRKIRTIIRARGPSYPNLNGPSISAVRVDQKHNLISLATRIDPSPDWILGISGVNLCMPNCTWLDEKIINLYPWDIGTDSGPTYTSPDQPQKPPDVIRRIRANSPNDPRSPFFSEDNSQMKPFAILAIQKLRTYDRLCEDSESNNINVPAECATHPWSLWSPCTVTCGQGMQYRTRVYKIPEVAAIYNCDRDKLRQYQECGAPCEYAEMAEHNVYRVGNNMIDMDNDNGAYNNNANDLDIYGTKHPNGKLVRYNNNYNGNNDYNHNMPSYTRDNYYSNPQYEYNNMEHNNEYNNEAFDNQNQNHDYENVDETPSTNGFEVGNLNGYGTGNSTAYKPGFTAGAHNQLTKRRLPQDADSGRFNLVSQKTTDLKVSLVCFQPLQHFTCSPTARVVGNFWFYNYCRDECMLYAADECDRNTNKFTSMEMCELRCHRAEYSVFLQRKQLEDCENGELISRRDNRQRQRQGQRRSEQIPRQYQYSRNPGANN